MGTYRFERLLDSGAGRDASASLEDDVGRALQEIDWVEDFSIQADASDENLVCADLRFEADWPDARSANPDLVAAEHWRAREAVGGYHDTEYRCAADSNHTRQRRIYLVFVVDTAGTTAAVSARLNSASRLESSKGMAMRAPSALIVGFRSRPSSAGRCASMGGQACGSGDCARSQSTVRISARAAARSMRRLA